jgi:hypothetical protein
MGCQRPLPWVVQLGLGLVCHCGHGFRIFQIGFQIKFGLGFNSCEFCSNLVINSNCFKPLNSNKESELGFQIQVNLVKQFRKYS